MRLSALALLFCLVCSCRKDPLVTEAPIPTKISKGVFGLRDAVKLTELGAEYTRIIVWDTDIEAIYAQVDAGTPLNQILYYNQVKSIHDNGVKIILTLRWPDPSSSDPELYDRVPLGQDRTDALNLISRFLTDFGSLIEVYSIQNEVGGLGPGTYAQSDMVNGGNGSPAVLWWTDIVDRIQVEKSNNSNLQHLKVSSPAPVLLKRLVFDSNGLPQTNIDFFYETIEFGNDHCDYIDFHFNTFSLGQYQTTLDFINPLVSKPMIATEWSEVGSALDYIQQPISSDLHAMAASLGYTIPGAVTIVDDLIEHMYTNPCPMALWEYMVEESDYHTGFMGQSSQLLQEGGFEIICWNSGWQEGLTAYDLRSFYATHTVQTSPSRELSVFTTEFSEL